MSNEVDQLLLEAQHIDAQLKNDEFTQQEPEQQPSINENFRPAIIKFLGFAVGLVNARVPFVTQHFNEAAIQGIADSLIKVADVEGIDLNQLFGDPNSRFGAWVALAVAVGLPSFTLYLAIQEYKENAKKQPTEKEVKPAEPASDHQREFHA